MKLAEFIVSSNNVMVNGNHVFANDALSAYNIAKHIYGKNVICVNLVDEVNNVLKKGTNK